MILLDVSMVLGGKVHLYARVQMAISNVAICNIEFLLHLQLMVANKCKPTRYTVAQALRILLQPEESSDLEDSDILDVSVVLGGKVDW